VRVGSLVINSGGLGTYLMPDCSTGQLIDCDAFSNFFNSTCWGPFSPCALDTLMSAAGGLAPLQTMTVTVPPPLTAPTSNTPGSDLPGDAGQQAAAAVQGISNQQILATQAANAKANPPSTADYCASTLTTSWPWLLQGSSCAMLAVYAAAALALFLIVPQMIGGRR
jgi:hypothetical protein